MRILLAVLVLFSLSFSQVQTTSASGTIDWSKRVLLITGIGAPPPNVPLAAARPNALRAALAIAMRNAIETVKGISINSTTSVTGDAVTSDVITSSVSGTIKRFEQKGKPKYMSDGSVEVSYEVAINGELADAILPKDITVKPTKTSFVLSGAKKTIISGLIVNCKGLNLSPSMTPKIYGDKGELIYSAQIINRDFAVKNGCAIYVQTPEATNYLSDIVGTEPLTINAVSATGSGKTDAVISKQDADIIKSTQENIKPLSECRIIFIVD